MPYEKVWTDPELYLDHKGVKVYRAYEADDADEPDQMRFTVDPKRTNAGTNDNYLRDDYDAVVLFDLTDLPTWAKPQQEPQTRAFFEDWREAVAYNTRADRRFDEHRRMALIAAIELGCLTQAGIDEAAVNALWSARHPELAAPF